MAKLIQKVPKIQRKARQELDPRIDPRGDHLERASRRILDARNKKK